jgi:predicted nucleic acid-binding protein
MSRLVFFDNNVIELLYHVLEKEHPRTPEETAILSIWENDKVVTTNALFQEVTQGAHPGVAEKIKRKLGVLKSRERASSTPLFYGEGAYGEGRYGLPVFYYQVLRLFKDPQSVGAMRDAQHILNCHDNKIQYLVTLDKELLKAGGNRVVRRLGLRILRPTELVAIPDRP